MPELITAMFLCWQDNENKAEILTSAKAYLRDGTLDRASDSSDVPITLETDLDSDAQMADSSSRDEDITAAESADVDMTRYR